MPLPNGTWVEFTSFHEKDNGEIVHLHNVTGVVVDSFELDGVVYYTVQHYEGNNPVPEPNRHPVRDEPLMIRALTHMPPLRVLPDRAAAIEAEAKMSEAAKRQ